MKKPNNILARSLDTEQIHLRAAGETGERYIEGYAIIFNQRSKLIRENDETFFEVIEPSAVDNVLRSETLDVIATVNHDSGKMLARTKSGTLELIKDEKGLMYRIKVPNTTLGNDMAEMVSRGDYYESSFIFGIARDGSRTNRSEKIPVKHVSNFSMLKDIAIVTNGAYANTAVQLRSQEWETAETPPEPVEGAEEREEKENPALDILRKEIEIFNLK